MVTVEEAVETVLRETLVLPAEEAGFTGALGRTLAADVLAAEAVPPFRASIQVRAECWLAGWVGALARCWRPVFVMWYVRGRAGGSE